MSTNESPSTNNNNNNNSTNVVRSRDYLVQNTEKAYDHQVRGAIEGSIRWFAYSASAMYLAHHMFPFVRRQTLAGKAFVVTCGVVYGFHTWQERYLLDIEHETRFKTDATRREAMAAYARQGKIASELDIQKWISENKNTDN